MTVNPTPLSFPPKFSANVVCQSYTYYNKLPPNKRSWGDPGPELKCKINYYCFHALRTVKKQWQFCGLPFKSSASFFYFHNHVQKPNHLCRFDRKSRCSCFTLVKCWNLFSPTWPRYKTLKWMEFENAKEKSDSISCKLIAGECWRQVFFPRKTSSLLKPKILFIKNLKTSEN